MRASQTDGFLKSVILGRLRPSPERRINFWNINVLASTKILSLLVRDSHSVRLGV
jgi:hypothetical protein